MRTERRGSVAGLAALAAGTALASAGGWWAAAVHWPQFWGRPLDLSIYYEAGSLAGHGTRLYTTVIHGQHWTYPPFAALVFVPAAWLSFDAVRAIMLTLNALLLLATVLLSGRSLGHRLTARTGAVAVVLAAAGLWLQPVEETVRLGQINLVLMVLVLLDLTVLRRSRWQGIAIGLATAMKLTPGLFVLHLVLIGRLRAALTAASAFGATVVAAFVLAPSASTAYWLHGRFADTTNVGRLDDVHAQSLHSAAVRVLGDRPAATAAWVVADLLVLVAGLVAARAAERSGRALLAASLVGLLAAAVSPFSWDHHWVWFLPLLVVATDRADRAARAGSSRSWLAPGVLALLIAAWVTGSTNAPVGRRYPRLGLVATSAGSLPGEVLHNLYPLLALVVIAAALVGLRGSAQAAAGHDGVEGSGRPGDVGAGQGRLGAAADLRGLDPGRPRRFADRADPQ